MTMNTYRCYVSAIALVLTSTGGVALAQTGERLSDDEVKNIIEQVNKTRDSFEDRLDGKIKSSTLRDATREVNVEEYLNDLQDNVGKLKDRFNKDYSAGGAEAATVLFRQSTSINAYIRDFFLARSREAANGTRLALQLGKLAAASGTTFPPCRRERWCGASMTARWPTRANCLPSRRRRMRDAISKEAALAQPDKEIVVADLKL